MEENHNSYIEKARESVIKAFNGQEQIKNIVYYWGIPAYLASYFVINKLIIVIDFKIFDIFVSFLISLYFIAHIYVLHKCKPKKKQLSEDELKLIKLENKNNRSKTLLRKFFLKEPIFKWNIVSVSTAFDLLCIAHFSSFFFK